VEKASSMKYDALSFICIDSKCLNYPPCAVPIFWKYRQHGASKQTVTANAKSYWEWRKMVSKVKFNPPCFILNKRSQPNDILGTDRTKQVEHMVGNRQERDMHSLYMQHHQMAKLGQDACRMLCVQNNWLPSNRQHNRWCLMLKRQGHRARIRRGIYYSITCGNDTS
jgi:hypothetical protein